MCKLISKLIVRLGALIKRPPADCRGLSVQEIAWEMVPFEFRLDWYVTTSRLRPLGTAGNTRPWRVSYQIDEKGNVRWQRQTSLTR